MDTAKRDFAMNEKCTECQKLVVLPLDFDAPIFCCPECGATYPTPKAWQDHLAALRVLAAQYSAQSQS